MKNYISAPECCDIPFKLYNVDITCRLCWKCQSCQRQSCDKLMYTGHAPISMGTRLLVNEHLTNYLNIAGTVPKAEFRKEFRELIRDLKDNPCYDCKGRFAAREMDFIHERGKKKFSISQAPRYTTDIEVVFTELEKCELVCTRCYSTRMHLANPGSSIPSQRSLDTEAIIMSVGDTCKVYMREPVTLAVFCDNENVKNKVSLVNKVDGNIWVCEIGPVQEPMVATITIDNQKLPMIITS